MSTAYVCLYNQSMVLIRLLGGIGSQQTTSKPQAALLFTFLIAESAACCKVEVFYYYWTVDAEVGWLVEFTYSVRVEDMCYLVLLSNSYY